MSDSKLLIGTTAFEYWDDYLNKKVVIVSDTQLMDMEPKIALHDIPQVIEWLQEIYDAETSEESSS